MSTRKKRIGSDIDLTGKIEVSDKITGNNGITVNDTDTQLVFDENGLAVTGETDINGNINQSGDNRTAVLQNTTASQLTVTGNTVSNGNLDVHGVIKNTAVDGNNNDKPLVVDDNLTVTGGLTVQGTLASKSITDNGNSVAIIKDINASGRNINVGTVTVGTGLTAGTNISTPKITGTGVSPNPPLEVVGNTQITGTLNTTSKATLNSLEVTNASDLKSTLAVAGTTSLNDDVTIKSGESLNVSNIVGNGTGNSVLEITGNTQITGDIVQSGSTADLEDTKVDSLTFDDVSMDSVVLVTDTNEKVIASNTSIAELDTLIGMDTTKPVQSQLSALNKDIPHLIIKSAQSPFFSGVADLASYSGTVTNNDYAYVSGVENSQNYLDLYVCSVSGNTKNWGSPKYRLWVMKSGQLVSSFTTQSQTNNTFIPSALLVKTQLDTKQPTITGGATTITDTNLDTGKALISDSNGKVAVSSVTATELGYVSGVTSAIQTQINGKAPTSHADGNTTYGQGDEANYGHVKVDNAMSDSSTNPVQNKVIKAFINSSIGTATANFLGTYSASKYQLYSDYTTFTTTDDYVGYYIYSGSTMTLITSANKDSSGITAGTTKAYELLTDTLNFEQSVVDGWTDPPTSTVETTVAQAIVNELSLTPTNNDYLFVAVSYSNTIGVDFYWRFKYDGTDWLYEYSLNNSTFTQAQWDSINSLVTNSGSTGVDVQTILTHLGNSVIHVTQTDKDNWNGKQGQITAGTGLSRTGDTINHSNSVTAETSGVGSATAVPIIKYDAQGHITEITTATIYPPTTAGTSGQLWVSDGNGAGQWTDVSTINGSSLLGSSTDILLQTPLTAGSDYVAHSSSYPIIYGTENDSGSSKDKAYSLVTSWSGTVNDQRLPTEKLVKDSLDAKVTGPASAVGNNVALFDGNTGKLVKDSGFTLGSSIPAPTSGDSAKALIVNSSGNGFEFGEAGKVDEVQINGTNIVSSKIANIAVVNSNPSLAWSTQSQVGTVGGVALQVTMPSNPVTKTNIETALSVSSTYNDKAVIVSNGELTFGEAGKVDDVKINGASIVTNKVANIPITVTTVSLTEVD